MLAFFASRNLIIIITAAALAGCSTLGQISTSEQKQQIAATERILVGQKARIREALDNESTKGALIFTENETKSIKLVLYGSSPLDAWINYMKRTHRGEVASLPLPSSISPTAAFIYASSEIGANELVLSAKFDEEVGSYYDLAKTMTRLGDDIQEIRDVTMLLNISDQKQNESVVKLKESFDALATNFDGLSANLASLEQLQASTRNEIVTQLNVLANEMETIRHLIESM